MTHLCELQVHHAPIKNSEPMHLSHVTYEFFREFFLGNAAAVEKRLDMLCALPVADAEDVGDLVDRVLGSERGSDKALLLELAELLESIAEQAAARYGEIMTAACPDSAVLKLAPLKGRPRAAAKAKNEYASKTAPATSWLFDVVRASVMCASEDDIVQLYAALDADPRIDIVRVKNRLQQCETRQR